MPEKPHVEIDSVDDMDDGSLPFSKQEGEPSLTLVHSNRNPKQEPSTLWPTGFKHGEQLSLFG